MRLFVSESDDWILFVVKEFNVNIANWLTSDRQKEWHKATVEELIEHLTN